MKPRLGEIVGCPICADRLAVHAFGASDPHSIEEGVLACERCATWYPIVNHVPVLLDFRVPLHEDFAARHAAALRELGQLAAPTGKPRPGERQTQKSFTAEWKAVRKDEDLHFMSTPEQLKQRMRLELDWPPSLLERQEGTVLAVGCGNGFEAALLREVTGRDVFAFDLNLELIENGRRLAEIDGVYPMVASAFALPFGDALFDLVYSNGVLHHTYSTKTAFDSVVARLADDGAVYLWVYAAEDSTRTVRARLNYLLELAVRPGLANLPQPLQSVVVYPLAAVQFVRFKRAGPNRDRWRYANALHTVRDRWTCRYAYRHSFYEVMTWFREHGLTYTFLDPIEFERTLGFPIFGIGIRGSREEVAGNPVARHAR